MTSPYRLLAAGHVFFLCGFLATPARALVLISEARSVTASYYGSGIETLSSPGTFGPFSATAVGIPFGGGWVSASQVSNITSTLIEVTHRVNDFYGPGGWAASNFAVRFSLPHETRIIISGYSAYFSGPASLVSESVGAIPLLWGPDNFYRNYLEFDQVLDPGVYTFTSNEWIRGDGIFTRLVLREGVPDRGPGLGMLIIGLLSLAASRRRRSYTGSSRSVRLPPPPVKRPVILCLVLVLAAPLAAQRPKPPPPPPLPATPEETAAINAAADRVRLALPAHLVFVGDSLTAMMPDDNYVAIIRQALQRRLGAEVRVTNAGVNGDTITRVQARLDRDVLPLAPKPTHVFLFLGHNDSKLSWASRYQASFVSPEDYERQYREVIATLQEKLGARVTVVSATASAFELTKAIADARARTNTAHNLFGQPAALERFNAIARRVATERGAGYLDVYTPTRTFPRPADLYRKDGVHVNERGNRLLAVEILRYLASPAAP